MKEKTIEQLVREVKTLEQNQLIDAVKRYGRKLIVGGYAYTFKVTRPCIACYVYDDPTDFVVHWIELDENDHIDVYGEVKDSISEVCIKLKDVNDIFAGHLDFVTSAIQ